MRDALVTIVLLAAARAGAECTPETLKSWKPGPGAVQAAEVNEEPESATEPRTVSVRCSAAESDDACESRARKQVLKNTGWTIVSARMEGERDAYEATLDENGTQRKQRFATTEAALDELKRLRAAGRKVELTKLHEVPRPESRVVHVEARAPSKKRTSRVRLRARLTWKPEGDQVAAVSAAMRAAELAGLSLSLFERRDDGSFTVVVACP